MRPLHSLSVSLLLFFLPYVTLASHDIPTPCAGYPEDNAPCDEPISPVTTVIPNSYYVAKLPCLDCPVVSAADDGPDRKHSIAQAENELLFNITLSHDRNVLLLNSHPIFPSLKPSSSHSTKPPAIYTAQIAPNFSRADLDTSLSCAGDRCNEYSGRCWCVEPVLSAVGLDYDYSSRSVEETEGKIKWEVTFDAIGGKGGYQHDPVWSFNRSEQNMLRISGLGRELEDDGGVGGPDLHAGETLFGPYGEERETRYELEILDVQIAPQRSYTFPTPPPRTFWTNIKHFFGFDPALAEGRVIYLQEEWDSYGKKGTLRNGVANIIYGWPWVLILSIAGGVIGALLLLYGVYRLCLVILEQRRLAQWGGMDEVWRQIREDGREEEDQLLDGGYRDDPDDSRPPSYTDEVPVNKPLPSKPLPEKPLPAVPLIDDI